MSLDEELNEIKLGFSYYVSSDSCSSSSSTTPKTLSSIVSETGIGNLEAKVLLSNNKNKFNLNFQEESSNNIQEEYCSLQIYFEMMYSHQNGDEELLNEFISSVGIEVMKSMDSTVRSLSCNTNLEESDDVKNRIIGMQVRMTAFDETSLMSSSSSFDKACLVQLLIFLFIIMCNLW